MGATRVVNPLEENLERLLGTSVDVISAGALLDRDVDPVAGGRLRQAISDLQRGLLDPVEDARIAEKALEHGQAGGHGQGVAAQRTRLVDRPGRYLLAFAAGCLVADPAGVLLLYFRRPRTPGDFCASVAPPMRTSSAGVPRLPP